MSVQNHTYNFNYPNMNFGQTILQGVFGSLTGCIGGGGWCTVGNGSYLSQLGNMLNGSFMGGYGCCGGYGSYGMTGFGDYTDQMLGMQIGTSIFNYGMTALGQFMSERKVKKAERAQSIETATNNVSSLTKEKTKLTEINNELENIYNTDSSVNAATTKACPAEAKAYTAALSSYNDCKNKEVSSIENDTIKSLKSELATLESAEPIDTDAVAAKKQAIKDAQQKEYDAQLAAAKSVLDSKKAELDVAVKAVILENNEKLNKINDDLKDAQAIVDEAAEEERVKFNNKNAKLEAKCDALGKVDNNKGIEQQSTNQGKFNRAYEIFKNNQSSANFDKLKAAYNDIDGNKSSFTKLMKHIIKQHPDFDQTNIQWS